MNNTINYIYGELKKQNSKLPPPREITDGLWAVWFPGDTFHTSLTIAELEGYERWLMRGRKGHFWKYLGQHAEKSH